MKEYPIILKLYGIDDLSEMAQRKAIEDHRMFMLTSMEVRDFLTGDPECDNQEQVVERYETEYNNVLMLDSIVVGSIKANEYEFFADGTLAHTIHYCGAHPQAGMVGLNLHGESYMIGRYQYV